VSKAPIGVQRGKHNLHVIAPLAQVVLELKMDGIVGVVEGEVGDVDGDGLARQAVVVAAQGVSAGQRQCIRRRQ
jgi:hypothetical protein